MSYTASQVAARAKLASQQGTYFGTGHCLIFVRLMAGAPAGTRDAATAWANARYKRSGTPPRGFPVYWTGGSRGFGHIAVSDGDGWCWTTDYRREGRIDRVPIASITRNWGLRYRGWAEDVNGVRIRTGVAYSVPARSKGVIHYKDMAWCARHEPGTTTSSHPRQVKAVGAELAHLRLMRVSNSGHWGRFKRRAYKKFQRQQGWTADGIPGPVGMRRLMTGYTIRP